MWLKRAQLVWNSPSKVLGRSIQFQFQLPSSKWNFLFFRKPMAYLQITGVSVKSPDDQFDIACMKIAVSEDHQRCSMKHQT